MSVDFLETLYASGRFFVRAPSQILGGAKCSTTPIGTGPFKLVSTKLNELVVAKNENYWREDKNGTRLPYLDGITFTFLVETASRVSGLKSKSLDMAMFTTAGEVKQIKDLQKNKNVTVIESAEEYYPSIWLNHRIAPFSSKNARLAVRVQACALIFPCGEWTPGCMNECHYKERFSAAPASMSFCSLHCCI